MIVPYSPGANADLIARMVTQNVATVWGQQVILDNRPGGATNIGSALAAKSLPDGYTLLLALGRPTRSTFRSWASCPTTS